MSRKKVKLQWIANDAARRATFKKRRRGLMKKVQELSILCNVRACTVMYGPYEPQPEVWPPSTEEVAALLRSFRCMPEHEQGRRRMDQESFLRQRVEKLREQIEKEKKAGRELQVELLMSNCLEGLRRVEDLGMEETTTLGCLVEMKLKQVQARIDFLRGQRQAAPPAAAAIMEALPPPLPSFHLKPPPSPPMLLPPPSPPVQLQSSNPYFSPLPPLQLPPYPWMEVAASHKLPELYASSSSAHARPAQQGSLVDQAAAVEGVKRPDWLVEMMGPYSHLFYEGEGLAPPPFVDDTKISWMMDPYLPFS